MSYRTPEQSHLHSRVVLHKESKSLRSAEEKNGFAVRLGFRSIVATVLLLGMIVAASGCGEDRSNLIPSETATQIETSLTDIETLAQTDCFKALTATKAVQRQVESLPSSVDANLKRSLLDGVVALQVLLQDPDKCQASEATTTEPAEPEPGTEVTPTGDTGVTTPEETAPEEPKPEKKTPAKKPETPEPNPTPTPEPEPTPTPETPPNTDPPADPGPGSGGVSPNQ